MIYFPTLFFKCNCLLIYLYAESHVIIMPSYLDIIVDNPTLLEKISGLITQKSFAKGKIIQKQGEISDKVYFVKSGCLRSYTVDEKGKEHIFMFAPEGWIISDIESQTYLLPCQLYIDAIENSEVEILSQKQIEEIMFPVGALDGVGADRLMKRIAVLQRRVIMLMSASALERYHDFLQTYPNIVQRVPQKMIASYLGITPEALSKIRGQIAKGKLS
jgi:CRP-like cAMP-binding protein